MKIINASILPVNNKNKLFLHSSPTHLDILKRCYWEPQPEILEDVLFHFNFNYIRGKHCP